MTPFEIKVCIYFIVWLILMFYLILGYLHDKKKSS